MIKKIKKVSYVLIPVLALCIGSFLLVAYLLDENSDVVFDVLNDIRDVESELASPTPVKDQNNEIKVEQIFMKPSDCLPGEKYDPFEKICYIECDTNEECDALEKKIQAEANNIGDVFFSGDKKYTDNNDTELTPLTTYLITGDKITKEKDFSVQANLQTMQKNTTQHQAIWQLFIKLIPAEYRTNLVKLEIATDGLDGTLAYVNPTDNDPRKWVLGIDPADAYQNGKINKDDFVYSLIHEFGHLLTLNDQQVTPNIMPKATTTNKQQQRYYEQRKKACQPQYYTEEGCSVDRSYINKFFKQFWLSIYQEFSDIEAMTDDKEHSKALDKFYTKYKKHFLTDYAVTNPGEDIAESWTTFVLKRKPATNNKIANQKVMFFYNYPELVNLRSIIRNRLAN